MAQFRCVEACYAGGVFYSPYPDGRQFYDGAEPPKFQEKRFVRVVKPGEVPVAVQVEAQAEAVADAPPPEVTPEVTPDEAVREIKAWQLRRLSKPEVMSILKKYNVDVDDTMTRADMIDRVIELQAKHNTNQDIAAVVKG